MTNQNQFSAPTLDFDADTWSTKQVVAQVFLGCLASDDNAKWKAGVSYVMKKLESGEPDIPVTLSRETQKLVCRVADFLLTVKPTLSISAKYPPLVWSRVAMQYWLTHGGCHGQFMEELLAWLDDSGNTVIRVNQQQRPGPRKLTRRSIIHKKKPKSIGIAQFLLDPNHIFLYSSRDVEVTQPNRQAKDTPPRSGPDRESALKKRFGPYLIGTVKQVIEDAVANKSVRNLSAKTDQKTGKYRFKGKHSELCEEISERYEKEIGKYAPSSLERAIRAFVTARKSWP